MKVNEQLELMASTDLLTGLKNRRYFQEKLAYHLSLYGMEQRRFSLLVLDIDHFKSINDTYGHPIGDLVLGNLAGLLLSISREVDIVARYGGEEFVIILANCGGTSHRHCRTIPFTSRFGRLGRISRYGKHRRGNGLGSRYGVILVSKADDALYASKTGGRNRVTHATSLLQR